MCFFVTIILMGYAGFLTMIVAVAWSVIARSTTGDAAAPLPLNYTAQ